MYTERKVERKSGKIQPFKVTVKTKKISHVVALKARFFSEKGSIDLC